MPQIAPSPALPPDYTSVAEIAGAWLLVVCHWQLERKLIDALAAANVAWYAPVVRRRKLEAGEMRTRPVQLFPGYVFVADNEPVREVPSPHVAGIIADSGAADDVQRIVERARFINEITMIESKIKDGTLTKSDLAELNKILQIKAGPYRGATGPVVRVHKNKVTIDGGGLGPIETDIENLEPAA